VLNNARSLGLANYVDEQANRTELARNNDLTNFINPKAARCRLYVCLSVCLIRWWQWQSAGIFKIL